MQEKEEKVRHVLAILATVFLLQLPVVTIDNGQICWKDENGSICVAFGDAMGIFHRLEELP